MELITFYFLAALTVLAALLVVFQRRAVYSALALVVCFGSMAALFFLMGAYFIAAIQVIVYAGAIMVLFVFAIMVLIPGKEESGPDPRRRARLLALPIGGTLLLLLVFVVAGRFAGPGAATRPSGTAGAVGRLLFTNFVFPFELTSVLLLAAMVGVLLLARRRA